jgi:hypothetical protein
VPHTEPNLSGGNLHQRAIHYCTSYYIGSMSDDYLYLPVQPASASLTSHIQALDLLAARLSSLQTRVEWETRVPLNSKASVKGRIVDTGNVKINIGGEWWVDMTPLEGEQWIRRRKTGMYRFYRGESADR